MMLQAGTAYPLKRFALKVLFLSAFGLLQWQAGMLHGLSLAFLISGNLSACLAVLGRSRPITERRFTYWDEAAAFLTLSALVSLCAGPAG